MISTCRAEIRPSSGMQKVPLGAADDEPMIANADDLAVGLAVVEHRQARRPAAAPSGGTGLADARGAGRGAAAGAGAGGSTATGGPGGRPLWPDSNAWRMSSSVSIKVPDRSTGAFG